MPNLENITDQDKQWGAAHWSSRGYIDVLTMEWISGTSLRVTSGTAFIESLGRVVNVPSAITKAGLSLSASTWYHVYLYLNAGVPDIEIVTTAPATAHIGTARSKAGDASRRYVGSVRTDGGGSLFNFLHASGKILFLFVVGDYSRALGLGTATTMTTVSLGGSIPVTARVALLRLINTATNTYFSTDTSDSTGTSASSGITAVSQGGDVHMAHPTNSSQEIRYGYNSAPSGGGAWIDIEGYEFDR